MPRYKIEVESENAFSEARRQLESLDLTPDEVKAISIELEVDRSTRATIDENQRTLEDIELSAEVPQQQVEYGPRLDEPEPRGPRGSVNFDKNVTAYQGSKYADAVMPDTLRAEVLHSVDNSWKTSGDVSDEIGHSVNPVSAALSTLFHEHGYVKRRGTSPYEYTLTQDGKAALKEGERRAE